MARAKNALLLSVVVPFRAGSIAPLIWSLKRQRLKPRHFELILIHEENCDIDSEALRGAKFNIRNLVYERPQEFTGHSAGPMRNIAIQRASADRIVFVDSDCMLSPDCLPRHAAEAGRTTVLCGLARELPAPTQLDGISRFTYEELWMLSLRDGREIAAPDDLQPNAVTWQEFYTCNASVPRELAITAGLFDESGYRCHDIDLGYRLSICSARFHLDQRCQVIHLEHPRSASFRNDQIMGWRWLAQRYPEIADVAEDKRVILSRSYQRSIGKAETLFAQLTNNLPGFRCGRTWVLPPGTTVKELAKVLVRIPFVRRYVSGASELFLRLDKNCWDYSLIAPPRHVTVTFSVVIPAFNEARVIRRAVESVLRQTNQCFELIVVDDASTDGTVTALTEYFQSKRIRVLSNRTNRGLAYCLNRALGSCRGKLLLHLDADDWLEPHALETLFEVFESGSDVGAVYGAPRVHVKGRIGITSYADAGALVSTPLDCLSYPRFQAPRVYRVATLKEVGGWRIDDAAEGRYLEDRLMLATVAQRYCLRFNPQVLYNVAERRESLSRGNPLRAAAAKLAILYNQAAEHQTKLVWSFNGMMVSARAFTEAPTSAGREWSVIIPFRGDLRQLDLSLRSWLNVSVRAAVEFIVVVDGKDTVADISSLTHSSRFRFVQLSEHYGPAAARNLGVKSAQYQNLFFSDADRIVAPSVLALHEARHATSGSASLVVGDVFGRKTFSSVHSGLSTFLKGRILDLSRFRPEFHAIAATLIRGGTMDLIGSADRVWLAAQRFAFTDSWQFRWGELLLQYGEELTNFPHRWLRVGAGSLSMTRSTFESLAGFDEDFKVMEDWDMGIRAQNRGITIICAPEAESLHQVHPVTDHRLAQEVASRRQLARKHADVIEDLRRSTSIMIPPGGTQFRT